MSVPASRKRKRLLCRFNLHHKWVRRKNPEGEDYLQCKACVRIAMTSSGPTPPSRTSEAASAAAYDELTSPLGRPHPSVDPPAHTVAHWAYLKWTRQ